MKDRVSTTEKITLLTSSANWAWPLAMRQLFEPRGVSLLIAESPSDFLHIIRHQRIHASILDVDSSAGGLAAIKIIKKDYPRQPFLLLRNKTDHDLLLGALKLDVFSVINKPVDMQLLQMQLNRLFVKTYNSEIFA